VINKAAFGNIDQRQAGKVVKLVRQNYGIALVARECTPQGSLPYCVLEYEGSIDKQRFDLINAYISGCRDCSK